MPDRRAGSRPSGASPDPEPEFSITATPQALAALSAALGTQGPGAGLRVWVETGIHPQVRMMIDRPTPRDIRVDLGGVPVFVDSLSQRFLKNAEIQHLRTGGQEGFRVVGPNVPGSPGPSPPAPPSAAASASSPERAKVEERIRQALKQIFDPEIPMNLVDLGLIYGIDWSSESSVTIRMTLTSIGCPSTEQICTEVERASREASGLEQVKVEVVWDPPWTPERMSPFAKRQFGYA